jgi:integrase
MVIRIISRKKEVREQPAQVLMFMQLLDVIARDDKLTPQRSADICSGVRTLLRVLGLQVESTPADPRVIGERLKGITPSAAKLSPARLQNCRCLMDAAFAIADRRFGRRRTFKPLSGAYAELVIPLKDRWDLKRLRRVFHFATEHNVAPHEINTAFFDNYLLHLQRTTIPKPRTLDRAARKLWNQMCETAPGWPGKPVSIPSYVDHWVLNENEFPTSLFSDLDAYLKSRIAKHSFEIDDLLSEDELFGDQEDPRIEASPVRSSTAQLIRYRVRQFASALVRANVMQPDQMVSLKTLVSPVTVNSGLMFLINRAGGNKRNSQIRGIASDLMMIARLWVRSSASDIAKLKLMVKKTRPEHEGLPESARRSLAPFRDLANVRAFLALPEAIVEDAERETKINSVIANRVAAALWMKIAQRAPLRINNLLHTDLQTNVLRAHAGKGAAVALFYPPEEVKNSKAIEVPLPSATVRMLDLYLKKYRPLLTDKPSSWLFPATDGGPKRGAVMSADIQTLMQNRIGFRVNPHSFRHVAAKLYLTAHPGQYEIVQRLLGHKSRDTTFKYYCELEAEEAFKHFDAVLLKLEVPPTKGGH